MMGAEGHRSLQEINILAAGSPTHFLRIVSYGLANLRRMSAANYKPRDITDVAAGRQELPGVNEGNGRRSGTFPVRMNWQADFCL